MTDDQIALLERIAYNHTGLRFEMLKEGRTGVTHSDPRYLSKEQRKVANSFSLKHHAEYMDAVAEQTTRLYSHLKKRVFDEYAIVITPDWEQRVIGGEHDVPLPKSQE